MIAPLSEEVQLVATVDACPTPVVDLLGLGSMYDWGRLAGVISLSDLAAMGATPLALMSSTYMMATMRVDEYEAYLRGLSAVCEESDTPIIGGNIREGSTFAATTVALGTCHTSRAFRRSGAAPNDVFIAIGYAGLFWSAVLGALAPGPVAMTELERSALFRPRPKLAEAHLLRDARVVTSAVDCSDGLGAGVAEICTSSAVGATIRFDGFRLEPPVVKASHDFDVPLERLLLAWGDWQLLVTVRPSDVERTLATLHGSGFPAFTLGGVHEDRGIFEEWNEVFARRPLEDTLASIRFEGTSYLQTGLAGYVERLKGGRV